MKKSTIYTIHAMLHNEVISDEAREEAMNDIDAEVAKNDTKVAANRQLYATAYDVVMAHLNDTPQTSADLFAACENELPEGFTKGRLQYALREYWADKVTVTEDTVNLYSKRQ